MRNFARSTRTLTLSTSSFIFSTFVTLVVLSLLAACAGTRGSGGPASTISQNKNAKKTMRAFGSEDELKKYFKQLAEQQKKEMAKRRAQAPPAPSMSADQSVASSPA